MITVQNLIKRYVTRILFDRISFSINSRERIGLVGRNGHGKTTLLKIIKGEETYDEGVLSIPKGYRIGYLSQHLRFTRSSILEEVCQGLPEYRKEEEWTVKKVLLGLGFSEKDFMRPPDEFSGGFQVRLNLASVLVSEPDLLLLDEPTNFLDIVSIRWLTDFLKSWRSEMIVVSHDRDFMDNVSTHILGIHRKKIKKVQGDTKAYYDQISLEEEVHEKRRQNDERKRRQMEVFISRFRAKARQANLVQSRIKTLQKRQVLQKLDKISSLSFSFQLAPFEAKYLFQAHGLTYSYSRHAPFLIEGLDLIVGKNDRICVIGRNGKGKTTLLKLLSGQLSPVRGNIKPHPMMKMAHYEQANTIQLNSELSVEEEIGQSSPSKEKKVIRDICGAMMFSGDDALKKIRVLSGGEKCRVLIGKLLASPANLLVLDEPTHHLDMESTEALIEAVEDFDGAVIMVTHNEHILHRIATRLIVFQKNAQLVFPGTYLEFLEDVGWEEEKESVDPISGKGTDKQMTRKDLKKIRAEQIAARSKVLSPYKKKIEKLEHQITQLEVQKAKDSQALVVATETQDKGAIVSFSRSLGFLQIEIDRLYQEWQDISDQYEQEKDQFEMGSSDRSF
ncbi:MAG: ABC-F family ATP-binding cassette domain-containing protein [Candidatus Aureabacteria bacterium]|nr:ABC-F family ATP-binding cassette domain-containing protein [Candidatus Auribacterota bacterium]